MKGTAQLDPAKASRRVVREGAEVISNHTQSRRIRLSIKRGKLCFPAVSADYQSDVWRDALGREFGFSLSNGCCHWIELYGLGSYLVRTDTLEASGYPFEGVGRAVFAESFWHWVAPLVVQQSGWGCLHASAVLTPRGVVAFCGPAGRGKSTLARVWSLDGAAPYADDTLPFTEQGGMIVGARLPQPPRLKGPAAEILSVDRAGRRSAHAIDVIEYEADLDAHLRPLRAIFWLAPMSGKDSAEPPVLKRMNPAVAFPLMLKQAACDASEHKQRNFEIVRDYLSLVRQIPIFQLMRPAGFDRMPEVLSLIQSKVDECSASSA